MHVNALTKNNFDVKKFRLWDCIVWSTQRPESTIGVAVHISLGHWSGWGNQYDSQRWADQYIHHHTLYCILQASALQCDPVSDAAGKREHFAAMAKNASSPPPHIKVSFRAGGRALFIFSLSNIPFLIGLSLCCAIPPPSSIPPTPQETRGLIRVSGLNFKGLFQELPPVEDCGVQSRSSDINVGRCRVCSGGGAHLCTSLTSCYARCHGVAVGPWFTMALFTSLALKPKTISLSLFLPAQSFTECVWLEKQMPNAQFSVLLRETWL